MQNRWGSALAGVRHGSRIIALAGAGLVLTLVLVSLGPSSGDRAVAESGFSSSERSQIETIVREYLLANPEILLEMQAEFEKRQEVARAEQMKQALDQHAQSLFRSDSAPVIGNPDGDVTVVEFFDYNCGFCRRAVDGIAELVNNDPNVRVVMKELPIFGEESESAARVAIAAQAQGKYWEVHRALLTEPGRSNKAKAMRIAKRLGLDTAKLEKDMNSDATTAALEEVQTLAQELGIRGTPHFFVGDRVIAGAPEDLVAQLEQRVADVRNNGCAVC